MPENINILQGEVNVVLNDTRLLEQLKGLSSKVETALKSLENKQLKIDIISDASLESLKATATAIRPLSLSLEKLAISIGFLTQNAGKVQSFVTEMNKLSTIKPLNVTTANVSVMKDFASTVRSISNISSQKIVDANRNIMALANSMYKIGRAFETKQMGFSTEQINRISLLASAMKSLGRINPEKIKEAITALNQLSKFKFPFTEAEVARIERFSNALATLKQNMPTVTALKNQQRISDEVAKQEKKTQAVVALDKQRNNILSQGIGFMGNIVSLIGRQIMYSAIWTTIYGTIFRVNQLLREGVDMFKELETGASKALRTGLSLQEISGAFTPQGQVSPQGATGMKETVDAYRELITLQALSFTSKHNSSLQDYTDAVYELTSANIALGDALEFADTSAKVALATGAGIEETTRTMAGLYNVFGKSIKDAASEQEKFKQIANLIVYVWGKEQIELTELNNALKYTANIASVVGLDYKILIPIIGHLNTQMVRASTAGTGLRQTINAIAKDLPSLSNLFLDVSNHAKKTGEMLPEAFNPNEPLAYMKILRYLYDQLLKTGQASVDADGQLSLTVEQIGELLKAFEIRGGAIMAPLLRTLPELERKITAAGNAIENNFLDSFVKVQEMNVTSQFEILTKNLKALPASFMLGVTGSQDMAMALAKLNESFGEIQIVLYNFGKSFAGTWANISNEIPGLRPIIEDVIIEFVEWGKILGTSILNIGAFVVAIWPFVQAINAVAKSMVSFGNVVMAVVSGVSTIFNSGLSVAMRWVETIMKTFSDMIMLVDDLTRAVQLSRQLYDEGVPTGERLRLVGDAIKEAFEKQINASQFLTKEHDDTMKDIEQRTVLGMKTVKKAFEQGILSLASVFENRRFGSGDLFSSFKGTISPETLESLKAIAKGSEEGEKAVGEYFQTWQDGTVSFDASSKKFAESVQGVISNIEYMYQSMAKDNSPAAMLEASEKFRQVFIGINAAFANLNIGPITKGFEDVSRYVGVTNTALNEQRTILSDMYNQVQSIQEVKGWRGVAFVSEDDKKLMDAYSKSYAQFLENYKSATINTSQAVQAYLNKIAGDLNFPGLSADEKEVAALKQKQQAQMQDLKNFYNNTILKIAPEKAGAVADLINAKEKENLKELEDLNKKHFDNKIETDTKYAQFFMNEEQKKKDAIIQSHNAMLKEYEGDAKKQIEIKAHMAKELANFDKEQNEKARDEAQKTKDERIKLEEKAKEEIKKIREELLKSFQEQAQLELDIEKQKAINKMKAEYTAKIAGASTESEKTRLKDEMDSKLNILEAEFGLKDATLAQAQAQERLNKYKAEQIKLEKELVGLRGPDKEKKLQEIQEVKNKILQEELNIQEAIGKSTEEQFKKQTEEFSLSKQKNGILGFISDVVSNATGKKTGKDSSGKGGYDISLSPTQDTINKTISDFSKIVPNANVPGGKSPVTPKGTDGFYQSGEYLVNAATGQVWQETATGWKRVGRSQYQSIDRAGGAGGPLMTQGHRAGIMGTKSNILSPGSNAYTIPSTINKSTEINRGPEKLELNLYINGDKITGANLSPEMGTLLKGVSTQAEKEARRNGWYA